MSRLIVKNLPKSITADKLRETFGEKGVVTDVQLKYTKDGKFRHFGFVGFKSQEEAECALKYFNNSFINASKIQIELCAGLGDPNKPKAWSKYATDSSAYKQVHAEPIVPVESTPTEEPKKKKKEKKDKLDPKVKELLEKHKDDPLFAEFMETHVRGKKSMWSNDALLLSDAETPLCEKVTSQALTNEQNVVPDSGHESDNGSGLEGSSSGEESDNIAKDKISDLEYLKKKTVKVDVKEEETGNSSKPSLVEKTPKQEKIPVEFFTVKLNGLTYKDKKKDLKQFFHPLKPKSIRLPRNIKGIAYVSFATEKEMKQALIKNRSFLSGKRILVRKYVQQEISEDVESEKKNPQWHTQEENLKNEESIAESGRLFVRNLSYTITEEDLEKLFNAYGPTTEVTMPVDKMSRKPKGFALVTFVFPEHATKAYTELDGTIFHGRMLHLLPGKAKQSLDELMEKDGLTFKSKKMIKMKSQAGSSHNWNSLFLGLNAVADLIADKYNTTKDKVLDSRGSESIAVRLALGETEIVSQTRDFLTESGVQLDAFNQAPKQRSKTIILVKNLPAKTLSSEIIELFKPHGELGRVVLPPSGITAIVEFLEPFEARAAFTRLAYTKFKSLPLYLEWAPFNTFEVALPSKEDASSNKSETIPEPFESLEEKAPISKDDNKTADEEEEAPEPDTMLFVKNLNFATTEEGIKEHFKKCGPIHYVSIATKKNLKDPGQMLSLGYGFLQFKKNASAEKALKTMQLVVLDGHSLELKRSNRTLPSEVKTSRQKTEIGKQTGTKILVRNVPFQATTQEVTDLFKTFGELKAVRLPKKMTGTGPHRGFAFVEFLTKHDSKRAFDSLCQSTHLYGRRLVLEWATSIDNVDDLRKRTAEHFHSGPSNIKTLRKSTVNPEEFEEEM